jgi:pyruvate kinase
MTDRPIVRKTKIVCTLGPTASEVPVLSALLVAGMNVARFNMAHGTEEEHAARAARLREASRTTGIPVALLVDIKGPEVRTGAVAADGSVVLEAGRTVSVTGEPVPCTADQVSVSWSGLPALLEAGRHLLIADGLIDLEVTAVEGGRARCVVRSGGELGSHKNVNVPGVRTRLPAVTERDAEHLAFAVRLAFDFVAASFVRRPEDVIEVRTHLFDLGSRMHVIAKIEDEEGLANAAGIARVADGIMVARGDLGVRLAVEEIPLAQKRIIAACQLERKPVITATQMLDSMIRNPRPTRAEATDVANAIFDGTDAVMLSGETASGAHPVAAVETMDRIARAVEASPEYASRVRQWQHFEEALSDTGLAVARSACQTARDVGAVAIIAPSLRGNSPRLVAAWRPAQPVLAVTPDEAVRRQLLLTWGVVPLHADVAADSDALLANALRAAVDGGHVRRGDRVVIVAGVPVNSPAQLNLVKVHFVGTLLARGRRGFGGYRTGRIVCARDAADARARLKHDGTEVLVIRELAPDLAPLLAGLAGLVLEEPSAMSREELLVAAPGLVAISAVPDARRHLEDGATVTLHGDAFAVYEGVVPERGPEAGKRASSAT